MASDDLRARLVAAFRAAAFDCPGDCGQTETECVEQHPIQVEVLHFDEIAVIGGPVEALADVAVTIIRDIAVPLRDELARLQSDLALNDAAWGSVWLHGKWSWLTKNMTTPEREHAADCVARWCALVDAEDGEPGRGEPEGLRWWREPQPAPSTGLRGLLEHVGVDVSGRVITVDGVPIDDIGSKPEPAHSCGNCDGIDPDTCLFNPTRTKE